MILDKTLLFSEEQVITVTADSTNVIDLGVARDIGPGTPIYLYIGVAQTFTAGGAATLTISLQGSPDNAAWTTYLTSPAYALATLVAGAKLLSIAIPAIFSGQAIPRYLKPVYTVATGPMTAGSLNAGLTLTRDDNLIYPKNYVP